MICLLSHKFPREKIMQILISFAGQRRIGEFTRENDEPLGRHYEQEFFCGFRDTCERIYSSLYFIKDILVLISAFSGLRNVQSFLFEVSRFSSTAGAGSFFKVIPKLKRLKISFKMKLILCLLAVVFLSQVNSGVSWASFATKLAIDKATKLPYVASDLVTWPHNEISFYRFTPCTPTIETSFTI